MLRHVRTLTLGALILAVSSPAFAQRIARRVFVEVTDGAGQPVPGLTAADFELTENAVARPVVRAVFNPPQRVLLLVDSSATVGDMLNHFRGGLASFLSALPGAPEIGLVTSGSQMRLRAAPMADRQKLIAAAAGFSPDGGANAFYDALLEADRRFLAPKPANNAWPVIVILTTDFGESRDYVNVEEFNRLVNDLIVRGAAAHAIIVRGKNSGMISELAQNLVSNLGGIHEALAISTAVPDLMKTIAERVDDDFKAMANRYELEYQTDGKSPGATVGVALKRSDVTVKFSVRRPF